jgi:hypothetical protein
MKQDQRVEAFGNPATLLIRYVPGERQTAGSPASDDAESRDAPSCQMLEWGDIYHRMVGLLGFKV